MRSVSPTFLYGLAGKAAVDMAKGISVASVGSNEAEAETEYRLVRPSSQNEVMFAIFNELGSQSNLVLAATYDHPSSLRITRDALYAALKSVIEQHYCLGVVPVDQPSERSTRKHRLWEAQLPSINLDAVVQFIDDVNEGEGFRGQIEETHNEWFEPGDYASPRWGIKVVNGRHVFFIYDHFIADGLSGYAFHRSLLAALNQVQASRPRGQSSTIVVPKLEPPAYWSVNFPFKISYLILIIGLLRMHLLRLLFGSKVWFADAQLNPKPTPWSGRFDKTLRCRNSVFRVHIPAHEHSAILKACKKHDVTFTALLNTMTLATFAADMCPDAYFGLTSVATSCRPFTYPRQSADVMVNSATAKQRPFRLGKYRAAVALPGLARSIGHSDGSSPVHVHPELVWDLARAYGLELHKELASGRLCNNLLAWTLLGEDKEDIFANAFSNLTLFNHGSILISNLGPFEASSVGGSDSHKQAWSIADVQFSASATKSDYGPAAPVINIAGVRGGDCCMNITIEDGLFPKAKMETVLERLRQRLLLMVRLDGKEKTT